MVLVTSEGSQRVKQQHLFSCKLKPKEVRSLKSKARCNVPSYCLGRIRTILMARKISEVFRYISVVRANSSYVQEPQFASSITSGI